MCLYLLSIQHGIWPLLSNDLFRICLKYIGFTRSWRREMPIVVNFIVSNIGDIIWNLFYLRALWQLKAGSLSIRIAWWMHGLSFRKELLGFIGFGVSTYLIVESELALSTTDRWIRWWWCDQFNHNEDPKQKMGWLGDWTNPITQLRHYIIQFASSIIESTTNLG